MNETKVCKACLIAKPAAEFYLCNDRRYTVNTCKRCKSKRSLEVHRKRMLDPAERSDYLSAKRNRRPRSGNPIGRKPRNSKFTTEEWCAMYRQYSFPDGAAKIVPLVSNWKAMLHPSTYRFFALLMFANRLLLWQFKAIHRNRLDPELKLKRDAYNALPSSKEKVKANTERPAYRERKKAYSKVYSAKLRTKLWWNIRFRLSARVRVALKRQNGKKAYKTVELIGCTVAALRAQLESQFTEGMTWELFLKGEIHIDHRMPCSSFDLTDPAEQKKCFHHTNLQPLWALDNIKKRDTIPSL